MDSCSCYTSELPYHVGLSGHAKHSRANSAYNRHSLITKADHHLHMLAENYKTSTSIVYSHQTQGMTQEWLYVTTTKAD